MPPSSIGFGGRLIACILSFSAAHAAFPSAVCRAEPAPPPWVTRLLEQELLPARASGDPQALVEVARKRLGRLDAKRLQAVEDALQARDLSLSEMLMIAHGNALRANEDLTGGMVVPEALLVTEAAKKTIDDRLRESRELPLMQDPLPTPKSLDEYHDILWQGHVAHNELLNLKDVIALGAAVTSRAEKLKSRVPDAKQLALLETDFPAMIGPVRTADRALNEAAIEFRLQRVDFAREVLRESKDVKRRRLAAMALVVDGEILSGVFSSPRNDFQRPALARLTQADVKARLDQAEQYAGDLLPKSQLLYAGLHWWMRGRYGAGVVANGLLKAPAAERNPQARIPLFMPKTPPTPTDPLARGRKVPDYARRHYFTWAWEDRQFTLSSSTSTKFGQQKITVNPGDHVDYTLNNKFY